MPNITNINVSLPRKLREDAERKLSRASYGSMSEYVRELIRQDLRGDAISKVDAMLLEGIASGEPKPASPARWRKLRVIVAKARRRAS